MPSVDSPDPRHTASVSKPISISLASKAKSSSNSSSKSHTPRISSPLNPDTSSNHPRGQKRPRSSLAHDESDSDDAPTSTGHQAISAFDTSAGGAISANGHSQGGNQKAPLVINRQKNRDWREESRRKKGRNLLPAEVQAARNGVDQATTGAGVGDVVNGEAPAFGLTFVEKGDKGLQTDNGTGDVEMSGLSDLVAAQISHGGDMGPRDRKPKTADEEALEALMGDESKKKSELVLPALNGLSKDVDGGEAFTGRGTAGMNEDDSFRTDVASRPDMASLDDYAAVPVEEFGAALLRGMGWKEGDVVGKRKNQISKARVVERRPALLGIGAKEVPGGVDGDVDLGAWGKGKGGKGKRQVDKVYNPVLLKNKETGEMISEEELKLKGEERKREKEDEDWRARRDGQKSGRRDQERMERDGKERDRYDDRDRKGRRGEREKRDRVSDHGRRRSREWSHRYREKERKHSRDGDKIERRHEEYKIDTRDRERDRDRERRR